jgi:Flp pilus assembly protein TadD
MKLSRLALIGALAVATGTFAAPREAAAQGNPNDPVKDVARQRFQDGVKAFDAGRFEEARVAFEQAYTLSQSPAVLLNLGVAEAKTNRCVDRKSVV